MEAPDGPTHKRRKLSAAVNALPSSLPAPFSEYIVLARTRFAVKPDDLQPPKFVAEPGHLEINLRDHGRPSKDYGISFSIGRGLRGQHVYVDHLPAGEVQILEDAQKLESVAKYQNSTPPPLACTYSAVQHVADVIYLEICILWEDTIDVRGKIDPILLDILGRYLPSSNVPAPVFEPWEPREFYDHVHVPERTESSSSEIKIPYLESQLYPFQTRAVRWLLSREGVCLQPELPNQEPVPPDEREVITRRAMELANRRSTEEKRKIIEEMDPETRFSLERRAKDPLQHYFLGVAVKEHRDATGEVFRRSSYTTALPGPLPHQLPTGFETAKASDDKICYVNHLLGVVTMDLAAVRQHFGLNKGGILADEMGLGKTLEVIALVCLHRRSNSFTPPPGLRSSSATLIITPPSILEQWKDEIREHAPGLNVFHYQGMSSYKKGGEVVIEQLLERDVVLTTYNVIAKEVHYVKEKPDRNLRNSRRVEPRKSPLTQISWWRVVSLFKACIIYT